jgi:hypothetical protein
LHVQVIADRSDVAGLVRAEKVASAADLEVTHGDLEARAELGVLADGAQAFVSLLGQSVVAGIKKVGVSTLAGSAHPAAQLVELAEPEHVGTVDDQSVDRGHVYA